MKVNGNGGGAAAAPEVEPMRLPSIVTLGQRPSPMDGSTEVMLRFSTPQGLSYFFMSGEEAIALAESMRKVGYASKSGLSLPGAES